MYETYTQRKRIRNVQLVLLLAGGFFILLGFLRQADVGTYQQGFEELWKNRDYEKAERLFVADIDKHPAREQSHVGLMLALLFQQRFRDAERVWLRLNQPPDPENDDEDEPSLVAGWNMRNIRTWREYEGDFFYAQAWLASNRHARSSRLGAPQVTLTEAFANQQKAMKQFKDYITRAESAAGESLFSPKVDLWKRRFLELETKIANLPKGKDIKAAKKLLRRGAESEVVTTANIAGATQVDLLKIYNWHVSRAMMEFTDPPRGIDIDPYDLFEVRTWNLRVLSEMARRGLSDSKGNSTVELLDRFITEAKAFLDQEKANRRLSERKQNLPTTFHPGGPRVLLMLALSEAMLEVALRVNDVEKSRILKDKAKTQLEFAKSELGEFVESSDEFYAECHTLLSSLEQRIEASE